MSLQRTGPVYPGGASIGSSSMFRPCGILTGQSGAGARRAESRESLQSTDQGTQWDTGQILLSSLSSVSITLHVYGNQKKYKLISRYKNYLISFLAPLCETSTCGGTPVQFRIRTTHCDVFISLWR